ncbi:hypothetical protein EVG20_g10533 [Dentipellis fragilis]|uniref:Mg-dependent DNase n=1 Tax=Dentipellis fragilis TaxID=205917 RepID=A0A4Y9XTK4_9AGAM|nr:hypothetical protein EVG20_g10533 [Dentipellis fragilis]
MAAGNTKAGPVHVRTRVARSSCETDDFEAMLDRSRAAGVQSMIVTGGSLSESTHALTLAKKHGLYATVGCHPTRSTEFDRHPDGPDAYLSALDRLIGDNLHGPGRAVAIGECGLDYDRTHFATPDVQRTYFRRQLSLAKKYHLPLFLHSRSAHSDLVQILREEGFGNDGGRDVGAKGGVVHSFTGSAEECQEYMTMGFHVGINGCSLKTEENLAALKTIRLEQLMFETDSPWCSLTSTHASKRLLEDLPESLKALYFPPATKAEKFVYGQPVKGRNEPSAIGGVAWAVSKLMENVSYEEVVERVWKNTIELFGLDELQ